MGVPNKNIIGRRVSQARERCGLTQDQLSAHLARIGTPIDRAGISKIERGARRVFDYELKALARVLKVGTEWLLGG